MTEKLTFAIDGLSSVEARELRGVLLDASDDVKIQIEKTDNSTQDFGGTLVLILGAPAVVVVAQAIRDHIKHRKIKLEWTKPNGEVIKGENLTSEDLRLLAEKN